MVGRSGDCQTQQARQEMSVKLDAAFSFLAMSQVFTTINRKQKKEFMKELYVKEYFWLILLF